MLDFEISGTGNEKQTRATQVRHGESLAALIEQAALSLGVEKSIFLRSAIAREAQRVIEAGSRHVLTPEDARLFAEAMDSPPEPTPRALKAAALYRQRVVHAD